MKYLSPIALVLFFVFTILSGCKNEPEPESTEKVKRVISETEEYGYVNWSKTSVVDTPSAKWKATVYMGEKVILLKDTVEIQDKSYVEVKLSDDTKGWMRTDFIIPKAEASVTIKEIQTYTRPDIMSKKGVKMDAFTIVRMIEKNDKGWIKAEWKSKDKTWFQTSWIQRDDVIINRLEVEAGFIINDILNETDYEKKSEKYELLLSHEDYSETRIVKSFNDYYQDVEAIKVNIKFSKLPDPIEKWAPKTLSFVEFSTDKDFFVMKNGLLEKELKIAFQSNLLTSSSDYNGLGSDIVANYHSKFINDYSYDSYSDGNSQIPKSICVKYLMLAMSRNKDFIQRMFDKYDDYLYEILSSSDYENYDVGSAVRDLLDIYDDIIEQSNYAENLKSMYKRLTNEPNYWEYNDEIRRLMGSYNADNYNGDTDLFWAISFWVRRAGEGNMDVIHNILTSINEHYGDNSYNEYYDKCEGGGNCGSDKCGKCGKCGK